jgi:hypothetical protein
MSAPRVLYQLYRDQQKRRKHFLRERPAGASSWWEKEVVTIQQLTNVGATISHMCQYGMTATDVAGHIGHVFKPTTWMSPSIHMLAQLSKRCTRRGGGETHRHVHLINGWAASAAIYPPKLCLAILRGIRNTVMRESIIPELNQRDDNENCQLYDENKDQTEDQVEKQENKVCRDENAGMPLPSNRVRAPRLEKLKFFKDRDVWEIVATKEAIRRSGKQSISVRLIDVNKGDDEAVEIRSRLVACEMDHRKSDEFFAATPPLEAKRMLFSRKDTGPQQGSRVRKLLFVDVRRACFNAVTNGVTFVQLPPEIAEEGMCARLKKCMRGTRDAATRWEATHVQALVRNGFEQSKASPCCFCNTERNLQVVVHSDDFAVLGCDADLGWFEGMIQGEFECKKKRDWGARRVTTRKCTSSTG